MVQNLCVISANPIAREGLAKILAEADFTVSHAARHPDEIEWETVSPETVVIVDSNHANDQAASIEMVKAAAPSARCVALADEFDYAAMIDCYRAEAQGYIVKDMPSVALISLLRLVAMGQKVVPSNLVDLLQDQLANPAQIPASEKDIENANLSQREMDVLCCVMAGMANKVIARELKLSEATIKVHVKAILRKLEVGNRTQAAIWASNQGISPRSSARNQGIPAAREGEAGKPQPGKGTAPSSGRGGLQQRPPSRLSKGAAMTETISLL